MQSSAKDMQSVTSSPATDEIFPPDRQKFERDLERDVRQQSYKEDVKEWIFKNYEPAKTAWKSTYWLKHQFQGEIGYTYYGTLALWMHEWGFKLKGDYDRTTFDGTYMYYAAIKKRKPEVLTRTLTSDEFEQLIADFLKGVSVQEMADKYSLSEREVERQIHHYVKCATTGVWK